jgi:hypothetical protein
MFAFAAALALAVPPFIPPEPEPALRPAAELRCIYEETPRRTRDATALHMWTQDRDYAAVVALLSEAQDICRHRHDWGGRELLAAFNYAQSAMLLDYARARLSALHIDTSRFDRIYRAVPVEERTRRDSNAALRNVVADLLRDPAAYATDPAIAGHSGIYLSALISLERAERMWAGLIPFSLV